MPEVSEEKMEEGKSGEEAKVDMCEEEDEDVAAPRYDVECVIVVAGLADDVKLSRAVDVARELSDASEGRYEVDVKAMLEPDWEAYLGKKACGLGGACTTHHKSPLVSLVHEGVEHYVGGERELEGLCHEELGKAPDASDPRRLDKESHERYLEMLNATGNQYVYLDVQFNANTQNNKPRKLVIELYNKLCPKTCFNFRALTTGELGKVTAKKGETEKELLLHYRGAPFHRVVPGGWVMSGDIFDGSGSSSVIEDFPDETFAVKFDAPGLVAMSNHGTHTNNTQFFITLNALDWLDNSAVAFGRVIKGMAVVRQIGNLQTKNERPVDDCKIHNCGIINLKDGFGLGF